MTYQIVVNNRKFEVTVVGVQGGVATVLVNGEPYDVTIENYAAVAGAGLVPAAPAPPPLVTRPVAAPPVAPAGAPSRPAPAAAVPAPGGGNAIVAPMPGLVLDIKVKVGVTVTAGQTVAILEAMKMENDIVSRVSGQVIEILAPKGTEVGTGDMIMVIG